MPPKKQPTPEEAEFGDRLKSRGFTEATVVALADNGFVNDEGLKLLGKNPDAIETIQVTLQQKLLLKEHCSAVFAPMAAAAAAATPGSLHEVMGDVLAGSKQQPEPPGVIEPNLYLQGVYNSDKKYLDIVDYINLIPPMVDEHCVCEDGGLSMLVRTGPKRPSLDTVTVEEWCLANTRIMNKLMTAMPHADTSFLTDYMSYTVKVCQLFSKFDKISVLHYDREYRYLQTLYGFRWGTDAPHLHTTCLRPKYLPPFGSQRSSGASSRSVKARQITEVCRLYNTIKGCHFADNCKYMHKCNYPGCTESHSRANYHKADVSNDQPNS
jgi:hypothetical protein